MTNKFHVLARFAVIAFGGFALVAASEAPVFDTAPSSLSFAPALAVEPLTDTDDVHAPAVELQRPASLSTLVAQIADLPAKPLDAEGKCLVRAVFFEARGEPLEGQLAVAQVIVRRAASGKYPSSVCGVINQPRQFTFARRAMNTASADYRTAQAIALIAQAEHWLEIAPRAMSFHASHVKPSWGGMQRVARIGNHVFYR